MVDMQLYVNNEKVASKCNIISYLTEKMPITSPLYVGLIQIAVKNL